MTRNANSSRKQGNAKSGTGHRRRTPSRRAWIFRRAGIVVALLVGAAAVLAAYNGDDLYDLSVVGQGVPTVVQVHDPACPVCVDLRANVESVIGDFSREQLLLRYADLQTRDGADFGRRHDAGRVTLLFFSGDGELVARHTGLLTPADLRRVFTRHSMSR